jgi:Domain of unknown function (DUF6930)
MSKHATISSQDWSALYAAAIAFKELKCWEWMYDSDLFGVQNPETGEIGYCCVMGNLGEVFALNVYQGAEGLDSYWLLHEQSTLADEGVPMSPAELLSSQKCLTVSYEDRSDLHKNDLQLIRSLNLQFRGKNAWPMFRNYQPEFLPWFLSSAEEVRFLTIALQQAKEVGLHMRENEEYLTPTEENEEIYLVRVLRNGQWEDTWQRPTTYEPPPLVPIIDEQQLAQIKRANFPQQGTWITDCLLMPVEVREGERPFYPHSFLILNEAALPLGMELLKPGEREQKVPAHFLQLLQNVQCLPQLLLVGSEQTFTLLEPIARALNVQIEQESEIPVFQSFLEDFGERLTNG